MTNLNHFTTWIWIIMAFWSSLGNRNLKEDFPMIFKNLDEQPKKLTFKNAFHLDQSGGHLQGIQLYSEKDRSYAYLSGSSSAKSFLVKVRLDPPAKVVAIHELLPDPYRHAGGFQIYEHYLAVGIEDNHKRTSSKVMIFDISGEEDNWGPPLYTIEREGPFEAVTAGAVAITRYKKEILVAVANWDSRNIDFYACPAISFENKEGEFRKIASIEAAGISKENWSDPFWWSYQNINLFADAEQKLYLAAFARDDNDLHRADIFEVLLEDAPGLEENQTGITASETIPERKIRFQKCQTKTFECTDGADFRAGAGIHVQNDGSLVLASCPYLLEEKTVLNIFQSSGNRSVSPDLAIKGTLSRYWKKTGEMPAAEAIQAAAATKSHIYAIDNTTVAQYDRTTGEKTATSSGGGDAKHLNSGFFWKGKLYIAHSNYPAKPDSSDIRLLDPKNMKLRPFKDFGESEGSLTWVIRQDGYWWCMFAYYGEENHKSYLARFDDNWREGDRWFFPPEVLARLGKASISGGIWKDGGFWVTGHDDRELYHVRLPKLGNVLEHVETVPAPFSGQGIAEDPYTGGLVGIDRPGRKVLFAEFIW